MEKVGGQKTLQLQSLYHYTTPSLRPRGYIQDLGLDASGIWVAGLEFRVWDELRVAHLVQGPKNSTDLSGHGPRCPRWYGCPCTGILVNSIGHRCCPVFIHRYLKLGDTLRHEP